MDIKDIKGYLLKQFTEVEIENAYKHVLAFMTEDIVELPEFKNSEQFFKEIYLGDYYAKA